MMEHGGGTTCFSKISTSLPPISVILHDVNIQQQVQPQFGYNNIVGANSIVSSSSHRIVLNDWGSQKCIPVLLPSNTNSNWAFYDTQQQKQKLQLHYNQSKEEPIRRSSSNSSIYSTISFEKTHPLSSRSQQEEFAITQQQSSLQHKDRESSFIAPVQEQKTVLDTTTIPHETKSVRMYRCKICEKLFTTSGHLGRHSRIHTGERKHVCPFPNCGARFARHDNCMQHYRTHKNSKNRKKRGSKKVDE